MKDKRPLFTKIPKWILIVLPVLIVLCLTITLLIHYQLKPFVAGKVRTTVNEASLGLYEIDFTDLHINLLTGSISFDSLRLRTDTNVIKKLRQQEDAPKHLYHLDVKALAFTNISFWDVYFHRKLDISQIVVYRPEITVTYNDFRTKEENEVEKTAYQQISKFLKSIDIGNIIFNEADFIYADKSETPVRRTRLKGLNISIEDFKLDSLSGNDTTRFYYTKNIQLNLKNHRFVTKDKLYTISIDDLSSSTSGRNMRLTDLRVKPNYPELEFSRKFKERHDRYDLIFKEIILNNIDFTKLNAQRRLQASSLLINGADAYIFMNRELPPVSFDKGRNYPHIVLRRLKLETTIDSVLIKNTSIKYSEYNPKSQKKGTVSFGRFNAVIRNVSNDSVRLSEDRWARSTVSTYLMNSARMNVNLNMHLTSKNGEFNFDGTVGRMDMRELNAISRNMSLAEIRSGIINKAEFKVRGDRNRTSGYLKLYYSNLKVNLLKKDEESSGLEKRGLLSAIANTLIIKNDNPDKDGEFRTGNASAERPESSSFFNLMWRGIFAGLKESVGFNARETDTEVKPDAAPPDKKTQRKMERQKRREARRAERAKKNE